MLIVGLPVLPAAIAKFIIVMHTVILIAVLLVPEWLHRRRPTIDLGDTLPVLVLLWILAVAGVLRSWVAA